MTTRKRSASAAPQTKKPVKTDRTTASDVPAVEPTRKEKKEHRDRVVRDSFTMPLSEYRKIAEIKEACLKSGFHVKKSEVLRAGLMALGDMSAPNMKEALKRVEKLPTGRPKKDKDQVSRKPRGQ